jgi:hypothetical protein
MSIAYDATSTNSTTVWASGTTLTWSHTCTGSDRLLVVGLFSLGASTPPTGVTYNGVSMTLAGQIDTDSSTYTLSLWVLINPATGSNSITATWASSRGLINGVATSYTGANQTTQPNVSTTNSNTGTSLTTSVTTTANNCWLVGYYRAAASTAWTGGTNGTIRQGGKSDGALALADSNGALATGLNSQTLNRPASTSNWSVLIAISPIGGAPVSSGFFNFF